MKLARATMVGMLASGLVLVVACSSSDSTPSGSSGTSGSSGSTSGDAGKDTGTASADTGVAKKATGATCTVDGDCESDHCKSQGAGGGMGGNDGGAGTPGTFCTVFCAEPGVVPAPDCSGPLFTGKCSGKSFCEIK